MADFSASLAMGQVGEGVISKWLQSRGHMVFPAYQVEKHSGKGPQLFSASGDFVLPDLLAFRGGKAMWFEAKRKTCFSWHRISGQWVTGIDIRHYGEYREVAGKTGLPVWLLFWHPVSTPSDSDLRYGCPAESPTGLFGNSLEVLEVCENHRSALHGKSGMVYWAEASLRLLAAASALKAAA